MALTTQQQEQIEFMVASAAVNAEQQAALEETRHANQMAVQNKQTKLEAIRLAKEVLLENARSKSINEREVSVSDITSFASAIETHINS